MIEINERFDVASPPDVVWGIMSNPHEVVSCVPGAALVRENEDGTYDGTVTVKFGPMRVGFQARVGLDLNEEARRGNLTAQGKDNQGGTRMKSNATFTVGENTAASGSTVTLVGGVDISGRLASLIEGGATIVVKQITSEFADRLAKRCLEASGAR